jgi:uncharacterized membrane protein
VTLDRVLQPAIAALAAVGAGIAAYLTATHFAHAAPVCTGGGCELVQRSDWATLGSVPVALLGLLAFAALFASALRRDRVVLLGGYGVALAGAVFAVYLIAVQVTVLHAVCTWCVASDSIIVLLAGLTAARIVRQTP